MTAAPEFFIGVDLGQKADFSAIGVLEYRAGGVPHFLSPWTTPAATYDLRHLERIALGTSYPQVIERMTRLTQVPEMAGRCTMVVDATGVGAPVVDAIRQKELNCHLMAVTITGGERAHENGGLRSVPKHDLIATLEVMLEQGELRIAAALPNRARLVNEMMGLRTGTTRSGHQTFGAGGRTHDDLVLAVALACWGARRGTVGHQGHRLAW